MKPFLESIFLSSLLIASVLGQQCVNDVVVSSPAALKEDLKTLIDNLDVRVDGNISCSRACDGIERRIDSLEADLDRKLEELFNKTLNEKLYEVLDEILARFNKTEQVRDGRFEEVLGEIATVTEQVGSLQSQLNRLHFHGRTPSHPAASCADILRYIPDSPSGYYWIEGSGRQYCDMTRSCGGVIGGWMRVAYLDMTNSSHQCPSGLRQRTDSNKRTCVKNSNPAGCSSVTFPIERLEYSQVCGKIKAYQKGNPDSFLRGGSIDGNYVDGVSLTIGSPRHHLWSFAACPDENIAGGLCVNNSHAPRPPAFVGNDYFCDTAAIHHHPSIFFGNDPLWDGAGCGPLNICCSLNNPPWFYKQLLLPTIDDVDMRVCRDGLPTNEDIAIETVDIYIQ